MGHLNAARPGHQDDPHRQSDYWADRLPRCATDPDGGTLGIPHTIFAVALGTIAIWHSDEGWGAIAAPERQGIGFVHFSNIQGIEGYRELNLVPGNSVEFEWLDDFEQDGCQWRVAWVRPV